MRTLRIDPLNIPKRLTKKPILKPAVMFLAALLILPLPTLATSFQEPAKYWTTVGSAGTVDEGDTGKVILEQSKISLKGVILPPPPTTLAAEAQDFAEPAREEAEQASDAALAAGVLIPQKTVKAVIRYNVTAVDGLISSNSRTEGYVMKVRFRDNGNRAQVLLRLIECDLANGVETVRMTFDSNQFPAQAGYQTQQIGTGCPAFQMDFQNKAYYVEATLTSTAPPNTALTGDPGLGIIQIFATVCLF